MKLHIKESDNNFTKDDYMNYIDNYKKELKDIVDNLDDIADKQLEVNQYDSYNTILSAENEKELFKKSTLLSGLKNFINMCKQLQSSTTPKLSEGTNNGLRYFVTDDDYIPLKAQPENGYTKLQAIQRAQREAEQDSKLFKISMSDAVKGYHIMDSDNNILHDLDNAI